MMSTVKLYHRTQFWGDQIQSRNLPSDRNLGFPVIWTQAIIKSPSLFANHQQHQPSRCLSDGSSSSISASKKEFLGCCRRQGPRVIEINEQHLLQNHRGGWDLYQVEEFQGRQQNHFFYKFVLVPQHNQNYSFSKFAHLWKHIGTIDASMARMDLAHFLQPYLVNENASPLINITGINGAASFHGDEQNPTIHAHVGIVTDCINVGLGGRKQHHHLYKDGKEKRTKQDKKVPPKQDNITRVDVESTKDNCCVRGHQDGRKRMGKKCNRIPLAQRNE